MKYAVTLALLALLVAPAAGEDDGIHTRTLTNGLRIVVKEDHGKPLAALRIYVNTGAALETEFLGCGISHYYEHLLSGGTTKNRTEAESAKILQELGGQSNAYTTSDHTCYHIVTHRDFIGKAIDLYGDWMMNNVLDPNEVAREKQVIIKEFNMGEDEPNRVHWKLFQDAMYKDHPMRVPTIGYRENFLRITRDDLVNYYRNRYAPNNTVVAVAGDVDPEKVFAMVEKAMGKWERRPEPIVVIADEPRQTSPRLAVAEHDVKQAWVRMGYKTIDLFHLDLYALDMVAAVLANGRSSRLFRRVVEKEGLTNSIQAYSYTPHWMDGVFSVIYQVPMENLDRTKAVVMEEIDLLKDELVTEKELARAKIQVVSEYQLGLQAVDDQATEVGRNFLNTGNPRFSTEYTDRIQKVTPEELRAAARKWLDPNGLTTAMLVPKGTKTAGAASAKAAGGKTEVKKQVLPNGLTLLVKRVPGMAPVAVEAYALGGLRAEPAGQNGVSHLAAQLLLKGTKSRTAEEISTQVADIGGSIGTQSGNNTIGISVTLARGKRDLATGVDLLADVLQNATFPEAEFKKEKEKAKYIASRVNENWQMESYLFMRSELFGQGPYANPTVGTVDSIEGIERSAVVAFARSRLDPRGTVVAVAGDVDVEETMALLKQALGGFAGEGEYVRPSVPAPDWAGGNLPADRFAFKENQKVQGVIAIAFPGPRYADVDERAATLIMDAFTSGIGLPSGWLHNALRGGQKSLVYFVHLSLFPGLEGGVTYITAQATSENLKPVYDLLIAEMERLRKGEFTDEELEIGRVMALVSGPLRRQTVTDIAQSVALSELYGVGWDFDERFDEALKKVTREDVMKVVDRYMKNMLVAVTGPGEVGEFVESLKGAE